MELVTLDIAGTTVNDEGRVYDALRQAVQETGATCSDADLQARMGTDKYSAIGHLAKAGGVELDAEANQKAFGRFKEILHESYRTDPPTPVEGAPEAITALRTAGVKVALTTGFDAEVVSSLLEALGWAVAPQPDAAVELDTVVTTDDVENGRPAPDMIGLAMQRLGVTDPRQVLNAGDTEADVQSGCNAGVIAAAVLTGGLDRETLDAAGADVVFDSVAQIPEWIATHRDN